MTIVYDGDGNRVSKTVGGVTTNYLVDTNNLTGYAQVVEEIQSNTVVKTYTYGLDLISQRSAAGVNFYQYDGHGSVRGLTDTSANITDTYAYDAFGTLVEQTGTTANNYLYAGEQFDPNLGLYYNRSRYLDGETGRFTTVDSFEGIYFEPKSLHKYLYAHSDPISNLDPSGQSVISEIQALYVRATAFIGSVGIAVQRAFQNGTIGNFWRELGQHAEEFAEHVLALRPDLIVQRSVPYLGRTIDFFVRLGDRAANIEVKYSLPSRLGPAMDRLVAQVNAAAQGSTAQTVIWTLKEPSLAQVRLVLSQTSNVQVQFVHGVDGLFNWIRFYFGG